MDSPTAYGEAYVKVFAKDSPRDTRRTSKGSLGYAQRKFTDDNRTRPTEYFPATPTRPCSVLNRPRMTESKKNVANLDIQFQKDKEAFTRRSNTYTRLAGEKYHHHHPSSSIITLWESGHIVDRGRGSACKPSEYNPIHHTAPATEPPRASARGAGAAAGAGAAVGGSAVVGISSKPHRSQSAPHVRPSERPAVAHVSSVRVQHGSYDPILHIYTQARDPVYEAQKDKEFARASAGGTGAGIGIRVDPVRASFDPIVGQCKLAPPAAAAAGTAATAAEAPEQQRQQRQQPQQRPASAPRARPAPSATSGVPAERPTTPGRSRIYSGATWGSYDPILQQWSAPPQDARFHDQNKAQDRKHGISGTHTRRVEQPRDQGIYNPILNTWSVVPANPRIVQGLAFAPATMFSRTSAATVKS